MRGEKRGEKGKEGRRRNSRGGGERERESALHEEIDKLTGSEQIKSEYC